MCRGALYSPALPDVSQREISAALPLCVCCPGGELWHDAEPRRIGDGGQKSYYLDLTG